MVCPVFIRVNAIAMLFISLIWEDIHFNGWRYKSILEDHRILMISSYVAPSVLHASVTNGVCSELWMLMLRCPWQSIGGTRLQIAEPESHQWEQSQQQWLEILGGRFQNILLMSFSQFTTRLWINKCFHIPPTLITLCVALFVRASFKRLITTLGCYINYGCDWGGKD